MRQMGPPSGDSTIALRAELGYAVSKKKFRCCPLGPLNPYPELLWPEWRRAADSRND